MTKELRSDLSKEELLSFLEKVFLEGYTPRTVGSAKAMYQAYHQICKLIKGKPKVRSVSKEFVEKWILSLKIGEPVLEWRFEITFSEICKMLQEAGVEVEDD